MHYLRHADAVIAFTSDGCIAEAGPTNEVLAAGGYVANLLTGAESNTGHEDDDAHITEEENTAAKEQQVVEAPKEPEEEEAEEVARDRDVYRYYFRSIGALNSAAFLLGGVCFGVLLKFPGMIRILFLV